MKNNFIFIGLLVSLILISCETKKIEKKESIAFLVTNPIKKDTFITKDYVSQIHSISHIELRAMEKGYLQKISVDEGQYVKKGQLMFQIMPNIYKAELSKVKAEAKAAEIEYKNTKQLVEGNVVSRNQLAMAEANLEKAKADVDLAQTHLDFTTIKAPFSGVMDHFFEREGSLLNEGDILTSLSDNSKMWVYFNVSEAEYLDYVVSENKGAREEVRLLMANNKIFDQKGIIETIEGEFNNKTGNIAFRATFPNPDGILRHGQTGSIITRVLFENAVIIPQKATFEILDKKYVYIIDKDNIVRQREITTSAELPHLFVVEEGLTVNDKILIEGIRLVRDEEEIAIKYVEPNFVLSHLDLYAE